MIRPFLNVEQDIEPNAGLEIYAGGDKFILHTTETDPGTLAAVRNLWRGRANWGAGLPHFLIDGARIVQLLPLTVNAYTMQNAPGGTDTNRSGHVVQVEIIHRSGNPYSDTEYGSIGKLMGMLLEAGIDFALDSHPIFHGANEGIYPYLATYESPIRFSALTWTQGGFWAGHQHAPENAHWDPGPLDTSRIKQFAAAYLAGSAIPATPPSPLPLGDDMYAKFARHTPGSGWIIWFTKITGKPDTPVYKVWCPTEAAVNMWKNDYQVPDVGYADYVLDGLPTLGAGPS